MNFSKQRSFPQAGFQMAPMVDIMFLLLIFFMAATIFAQWESTIGITVPTVDKAVPATREPGEIIINLDEQGTIFVNSVEMDRDRLQSLLSQVAEAFAGHPVIIRADAKTQHQKVIDVLDICKTADIWNVAFATVPRKK